MASHCEKFDHTADLGLAAQADSLGELFESLAEALADVIRSPERVQPRQTHSISCQAEDVEALAVDFLSEMLIALQSDHFMPAEVRVTNISLSAITADLLGEPYDDQRHEILTEVKAVTYHQLTVKQTADKTWSARIILDM